MRLTFLLLLTGLFHQMLTAQEDFNFYQENPPKVTGRLNGFDPAADAGLELKFVCVVPQPQRQAEFLVRPEQDGSFTFSLPYPLRYQQIWFSIGEYYYGQLIVDKELVVTADLPPLKDNEGQWSNEGVQFSGPDGELNDYLNRYTAFEVAKREKGAEYIEIMMDRSLVAAEKVERIRAFYAKEEAIEKRFLAENPSPHAWLLTNERLSDLYGNLFVIHWGKEMPAELFAEAIAHQPKVVSNDGMSAYYGYLGNFLRSLTERERLAVYQNEILPGVESPQERERLASFLKMYRQKLDDKPYNDTLFHQESAYFHRQYQEAVKIATIKAFVEKTRQLPAHRADLLKMTGGGEDIWERDQYMEIVLPTVQAKWCAEIMQKEWANTREKIRLTNEQLQAIQVLETDSPIGKSVGVLPNGAELYQAEQAELIALLGAIRANLPGKSVILDIWATWCGPCIYDMEQSKEKLTRLREMDVEVVYVCTANGTTPDGWRKKVAELDLPTRHIYLSPELSKSIMAYFDLQGYPSHVFLDKQGKYHPGLVHSIRNIDVAALEGK